MKGERVAEQFETVWEWFRSAVEADNLMGLNQATE
jgi:hypothetical protein